MLSWYFAALNSVEPLLMNLALIEFFTGDEVERAKRRPAARDMVEKRLADLERGLGEREWLVGNQFTVADLMTSSVLKIAKSLDILGGFPTLLTYQERCFDRPAYRKAIADQCAVFARHSAQDMKYGANESDMTSDS